MDKKKAREDKIKAELLKLKKESPGIFETLMGSKEVRGPSGNSKQGPYAIDASTPGEDLTRGAKGAVAALSIPDNLLWAAITPGKSIAKEIDNIGRDFPDSVLERGTEGKEFLEGAFEADPKRTSTKVAGALLDVLSPGGAAKLLGKGLGVKVPSSIGQELVKLYAKPAKIKNARKFLEAELNTKGFESGTVDAMLSAIDEDDMYKLLKDPAKLQDFLAGRMKSQKQGHGDLSYTGRSKREGGKMGKLGREMGTTIERAQQQSGKKINRADIAKELIVARKRKNAPGTAESDAHTIDIDKYEQFILNKLKHRQTKPVETPSMNVVISELDKKLAALTDEAKEARSAKKAVESDTVAAAKAKEKAAKDAEAYDKIKAKRAAEDDDSLRRLRGEQGKTQEAEVARRKKVIEDSVKERKAAELKAKEENDNILSAKQDVEDALKETKQNLKLKSKPPTPKHLNPVKTVKKDGTPADMKRIIDTKKLNERRAAANKAYEQSKSLPPVEKLQEMIDNLMIQKKALVPTAHADDFAPPPLTEEILGPVQRPELAEVPPRIFDEVRRPTMPDEVPPPMPYDKRPLEDIFAEAQDVRNAKQRAQAVPRTEEVDVQSDPIELFRLRMQLDDELAKFYKKLSPSDEESMSIQQVKELRDAVNESLKKYLSDVELIDGNAGEIFAKQNADYGARKDINAIAGRVAQKERKAGAMSRVVPAIAGAGASAATSVAMGGNLWHSIIAGTAGGLASDAAWGKHGPAGMANFWRNMESPMTGHLAVSAGEEVIEEPFEKERIMTPQELAEQEGAEIDWSGAPPEVRRMHDPNWREPKSIQEPIMEEKPIEQKMDERLNPGAWKPVFDPYLNEKILNTPIPRDSKRIMENPNATKAKLGQLAPQYLPMLEETLTQAPENLGKVLPQVAMMFPHAFEEDEYGMFDGKLPLDPIAKQKFFTDLDNDEAMDSISKAKIAMKAHRGESIY
jgi:hypothetical protein